MFCHLREVSWAQRIPYLGSRRLRLVGMTGSRDKNASNDSVPNFRGLFLPNQCGKQPFTNSFPREECSSTAGEEPAHYSHHLLRWLSEFRFTRRPCSQYLALYPGILFFSELARDYFSPREAKRLPQRPRRPIRCRVLGGDRSTKKWPGTMINEA